MLIIDYTTHKCHAGWGTPDGHTLSMHALIIVHMDHQRRHATTADYHLISANLQENRLAPIQSTVDL